MNSVRGCVLAAGVAAALGASPCGAVTMFSNVDGVRTTFEQDDQGEVALSADDRVQYARVLRALRTMTAGRYAAAITDDLDPVIRHYEATYVTSGRQRYFCARGAPEAMLYSALATRQKTDARILSVVWTTAYQLKAYSLEELKRPEDAHAVLLRALALSPYSPSHMIAEAHYFAEKNELARALARYTEAARLIDVLTPAEARPVEKAKVLRGQGFVLASLRRFAEARAAYRASLAIEPDNALARDSLKRIDEVEARTRG